MPESKHGNTTLAIMSVLTTADKPLSAMSIAEITGCGLTTVRTNLLNLQMKGDVVCRHGSKSKQYYLASKETEIACNLPIGLTEMENKVLSVLKTSPADGKSLRIIMKDRSFGAIDSVREALTSLEKKGLVISRVANKEDMNRHQVRWVSSKTKVWYRVGAS